MDQRGPPDWYRIGNIAGVSAVLLLSTVFAIPACKSNRGQAYKIQCAGNMCQFYPPAMHYSDKKGNGLFPFASGDNPRAHESLNVMLEYDQEGLDPELFKCPEGEATHAPTDEKGYFLLDASTSDYSWPGKPCKNTVRAHLSSDKYFDGYRDSEGRVHRGHNGGMNVLWTDGSVKFVKSEDLDVDTGLPEGLVR